MPGVERVIGPLSTQWQIHSWDSCLTPVPPVRFADRHAATLWLRQFRADPQAMSSLRTIASKDVRIASSLWRTSDDQLLEHLSWLLNSGDLHVHRVVAPATLGRVAEPESGYVAGPVLTARPQSTPAGTPAPPVEEPDTLSSRTDSAATAAVLRNAAANGSPFCEECAKAAAARNAA